MCLYVTAEAILANLLMNHPNSDDGIDFSLIEKYCLAIKKKLAEEPKWRSDYISFQVDNLELNTMLERHPQAFCKFMNRYYKGKGFDAAALNRQTDKELQVIFMETAKQLPVDLEMDDI